MNPENFWKQPHSRPIHLIFLCAGNICRSPYAAFTFKQLLQTSAKIDASNFRIASGGFLSQKDVRIHPFTRRRLIEEEHIPLAQVDAHVPRTMRKHKEDLLKATLLIVMTKDQKNILMPKKYRHNTILLSDLANSEEIDIPDPAIITEYSKYSAILDVINKYLQQIIHTLESLNLY